MECGDKPPLLSWLLQCLNQKRRQVAALHTKLVG